MKNKTKKEVNKIKKDMTFSEVLKKYPETMPVFIKYGITCIGCPMAKFETVKEGCHIHGIDVEKFVKDLNKAIKKK